MRNLGRIWCQRSGEMIVSRDMSHRADTPLLKKSRISAVLNEGWVVAEARLWLCEVIVLLST